MGTKFIIAGLIFLINPEIATFDILPDFVGYILMLKGIKKLAQIDGDFASAKRFLTYLLLISVAKFAFSPIVFLTKVKTNKLTIQFIFGVFEGITGFLFARSFFCGVDMLTIRDFGSALIKKYDENRLFALLFFPIKVLLLTLPQAVVLFYPDIDAEADKVIDFTKLVSNYNFTFNAVLVITSVFIVFFGYYAIKSFSDYRKCAMKDKTFSSGICDFYKVKFSGDTEKVKLTYIKSAFFFAFVSSFFLLNFYVDNVSVIPRFLLFVFIAESFSKMKSAGEENTEKCFVLIVSFAVISFLIFTVQTCFAIYKAENFGELYAFAPIGRILTFINEAMTVSAFALLSRNLKNLMQKYGIGERTKHLMFFSALVIPFSVLSLLNFILETQNMIAVAAMWVIGVIIIISYKNLLSEVTDGIYKKLKDR